MEFNFVLHLPHDEASVPIVRHLLSSALDRIGVSPACSSDVKLAVTEACTNVLKHANAAPEEYQVQVRITQRECEIEVADQGGGEIGPALSHSGSLEEESGRGIQLMRALVDQLQFVARSERGLCVRLLKKLSFEEGAPLTRLEHAAQS